MAFRLRLVDAEKRQPLEEYRDAQGQTWVVGEEGVEYFVELTTPGGVSQASVEVDGVGVGYSWNVSHAKTSVLGNIKAGGSSDPGAEMVHRSFAFAKAAAPPPASDGGGGSSEDSRAPAFGSVSATWYRATKIDGGAAASYGSVTSAWQGNKDDELGKPMAAASKKKESIGALKSTVGTSIASGSSSWSTAKWTRHEMIAQAMLRYSSEFGLTIRGIIKPEGEEEDDDLAASGAVGPIRAARIAKRQAAAAVAAASKDTPIDLDDDDENGDPHASKKAKA